MAGLSLVTYPHRSSNRNISYLLLSCVVFKIIWLLIVLIFQYHPPLELSFFFWLINGKGKGKNPIQVTYSPVVEALLTCDTWALWKRAKEKVSQIRQDQRDCEPNIQRGSQAESVRQALSDPYRTFNYSLTDADFH